MLPGLELARTLLGSLCGDPSLRFGLQKALGGVSGDPPGEPSGEPSGKPSGEPLKIPPYALACKPHANFQVLGGFAKPYKALEA